MFYLQIILSFLLSLFFHPSFFLSLFSFSLFFLSHPFLLSVLHFLQKSFQREIFQPKNCLVCDLDHFSFLFFVTFESLFLPPFHLVKGSVTVTLKSKKSTVLGFQNHICKLTFSFLSSIFSLFPPSFFSLFVSSSSSYAFYRYSFDATKSTKGASKLRRDLINSEIANLRDLLPLPSSTRQRLSQLQLMALVCVYVRKENYFHHGTYHVIPSSLTLP